MLQTRSNGLLVTVTNTAAGGGSTVIIGNSSNIFITNTSLTVMVQNSAGWVVNVANTIGNVNIINSAGWVVNVANTVGSVNIINSAGWVVNVANTSGVVAVSNTSGIKVFSTIETAQMSSNGVALTAGFAVINATGTNNTLVSAVTNRKLRVLSYNFMSGVGNNVQFQSGTGASNLLTGTYFVGSNGGLVAPYNPIGWFETAASNLLNLKMASAQSVGGCITYLEI